MTGACRLGFAVFAGVLIPPASWGASLCFDVAAVNREADVVRLPVALGVKPEEHVASFQFDLLFDPAALRFEAVDPGEQSIAAEKMTHSNLVAPGRARVVVAGLNRNVILPGAVVWIRLGIAGGTAPPADLTLSDIIFSDPHGVSIRPDLAAAALRLDGPASLGAVTPRARSSGVQETPGTPARNAGILLAACGAAAVVVYASRSSRRKRKY